ncbi:hypothetical protein ASD81_16590 [Nocardioides sp. Root614]|nr:hypothetical protein ASD81_16590 [Nocardioides sp. Root614]KRA87720.1 hypothetical protein ASD84_16860 [Nocardioides sp. Root682]
MEVDRWEKCASEHDGSFVEFALLVPRQGVDELGNCLCRITHGSCTSCGSCDFAVDFEEDAEKAEVQVGEVVTGLADHESVSRCIGRNQSIKSGGALVDIPGRQFEGGQHCSGCGQHVAASNAGAHKVRSEHEGELRFDPGYSTSLSSNHGTVLELHGIGQPTPLNMGRPQPGLGGSTGQRRFDAHHTFAGKPSIVEVRLAAALCFEQRRSSTHNARH